MLASLKDQLPPTDQAIARAIDSVASGAATPAAAKAEVLAVTPAAPVVPPAVLGVLSAVAFILAFVGCSVVLPGCNLTAKQAANGALSLEQVACVVAQAFGPAQPAAVVAVCSIPPALEQAAIDALFGARKAGVGRVGCAAPVAGK